MANSPLSRPLCSLVSSAALLLILLGACAAPPGEVSTSGSASVVAELPQALGSADVARVTVVVTGPGMSPVGFELAREATGFRGTQAGIAAGPDRIFEARAFAADGTAVYGSRSAPTSITAGQTAVVIMLLQQLTPPPDYQNSAPVIEAATVSAGRVLPGGHVDLTVRAIDPDTGDTLSYLWSSAEGSFSAPTASATRWTAPATERVHAITVTVTDAQGTASTLTLNVNVSQGDGAGSGEVLVSFNSWPSVTGMTASPAKLVVGQALQLTASSYDPDGDVVTSTWTSSCEGGFNEGAAVPRTFTPAAIPSTGTCTFTVVVSDGRGGSGRGRLTLNDGTTATTNYGPSIDSHFQSSADALARGTVTLSLGAHDPEGSPVTFSWSASRGTLSGLIQGAVSSEVTWTAPGCFDEATSVVATVTDSSGVAGSYTFTIAAQDLTPCSAYAVRGTRTVRYYLADGTVEVRPTDLSNTVVAAHVPRANGSGYERIAGQGFADGTLLVENVRAQAYFLQVGTRYSWLTTHDVPEVFSAFEGRPDVVMAAAGTRMDLALTGLSPWEAGHSLQFRALNAVGNFDLSCDATAPSLAMDATEYRHLLRYDECYGRQPLLDAARGDRFWVGQYAERAAPLMSVKELRRSGEAALTMAQGATTAASVALSAGAAHTFTLDLRATAFDAQASQPFPGTTLAPVYWSLYTGPSYPSIGMWTGMSLAEGTFAAASTGDAVETIHSASTLPGQWGHSLSASSSAITTLSLPARPDGSIPRFTASPFLYAELQYARPLSGTVLLAPSLGPVQALRLNGQVATSLLTGVGTTPTLSWSAPALGTPTSYYVSLYVLTDSNSFVRRTLVARFTLPASSGSSLELPEGVVVPGSTYYFVVGASLSQTFDGTASDGRLRQGAQAETLSHAWVP